MQETILSIQDLQVDFRLRGQVLHALRGVSLDVWKQESLAIVGESGCGKSVLSKTMMGLLELNGQISQGNVRYYGHPAGVPERKDDAGRDFVDLVQLKQNKQWLNIRGKEICMVPQDPMTSLNPLHPIGHQIVEAIRLHSKVSRDQAKSIALQVLQDVRMDDPQRRFHQYPHELSGGMRQRVVIGIAMACNPKILICDEPTTALDVTIQAQVLELLKELKEKYQLTILFITHDLGVVASTADRVAVMYAGEIVEAGMADEIFYDPRHPYTWALLSSLPQLGTKGESLHAIRGTPPGLDLPIQGDAFAPRNPWALNIDLLKPPPRFDITPTHWAKTWLLDPRAPQIDPPEEIRKLASWEGHL